jgi:hypothetical protein
MTKRITPDAARRLAVEWGDAELWEISHALDRMGEPLPAQPCTGR